MRMERSGLSRHASAAKAMDYMLKRWGSFARFLDDGRICLTNNAAERALRSICPRTQIAWLFAGSDRGGVRAAVMYTLIGTAKLNDADPQAWLADVLDRIAETCRRPVCTSFSPGTGRPTGNRTSPHNLRPLAARQLPTTTPPASRLPTATRGSNNSYTTSWDTTELQPGYARPPLRPTRHLRCR